jgi:hypothetical protein
LIAEHLEKVERGEIDRLMIFMPPRHGKSELASVLFPAWYIGRNPGKQIIASSYSSELAQDFGYQVRNLISDQQYKGVFKCSLRADSQAKGNWRTEQGGQYVAVGVGGPITGRGADLLLIDDPIKNREEADSTVYRDKIMRWYTSTAYTRLHKGGSVVVIQTRWHDDDLSGRLLKENKGEWTVLNLPALAMEDEDHRSVGDPLWEEKYDKEALLRIKDNIGPDWSPLYQQEPIDVTDSEFRKEWIRRYDSPPDRLRVRVICDLASSEDKRSDENAICVVGQSADQRRYVLASWGDWEDEGRRFNPDEVIDKIYQMADDWAHIDPMLKIYVETVSYQRTLVYGLKEHARRRRSQGQKIYQVEELKTPTNKSKDDKIRGLIPYLSNNMIFLPHGGTAILEQQMLRFPKGQRVDRLDTLAMDLDLDRKPVRHGTRNLRPQQYDPQTGRVLKYS